MFGIPAVAIFVFWSVIFVFSIFGLIFARKIVAWDNERIIAKGKEEAMTKAEMKRLATQQRLFFFLLLCMSFASSVEYLTVVFPR